MNIINIFGRLLVNISRYDWRLSVERPFVYDWQRYGSKFAFPGYDMHGDIHLLIMLKGTFSTGIGNNNFTFRDGDLVLIAPWEIHGNYSMTEGTELLSLTVFCSSLRTGISSAAAKLDALLQLPPAERMKRLQQPECISLAHAHAGVLTASKKTAAVTEDQRIGINAFAFETLESSLEFIRIQQLFVGILQNIGDIFADSKSNLARRLAPALRLLESNRCMPLSIDQAAKECNLSNGYFNVIFSRIYGVSFYAYELKYRLRCAEVDLRSGKYSIKELAQKYGFADASHFSRTFKKYYSVTPNSYL